jgi:hypothetical protein
VGGRLVCAGDGERHRWARRAETPAARLVPAPRLVAKADRVLRPDRDRPRAAGAREQRVELGFATSGRRTVCLRLQSRYKPIRIARKPLRRPPLPPPRRCGWCSATTPAADAARFGNCRRLSAADGRHPGRLALDCPATPTGAKRNRLFGIAVGDLVHYMRAGVFTTNAALQLPQATKSG